MIQLFGSRKQRNNLVGLPSSSRETVCWLPRIGDTFPEFPVSTTDGEKEFCCWARGRWTYFFSQPSAYAAVATAELVTFSRAYHSFQERGIQLMSISGSSIKEQTDWRADITKLFKVTTSFPGAEDPKLQLAKCFGMFHPKESTELMISKSFILDPNLKIRAIMEYPNELSRSSEEALDLVTQLQECDLSMRAFAAE